RGSMHARSSLRLAGQRPAAAVQEGEFDEPSDVLGLEMPPFQPGGSLSSPPRADKQVAEHGASVGEAPDVDVYWLTVGGNVQGSSIQEVLGQALHQRAIPPQPGRTERGWLALRLPLPSGAHALDELP